MYAIKIRKSDADLLALLNGGVPVDTSKANTYLIFDAARPLNNYVVNEKRFQELKIKVNSPEIHALKK